MRKNRKQREKKNEKKYENITKPRDGARWWRAHGQNAQGVSSRQLAVTNIEIQGRWRCAELWLWRSKPEDPFGECSQRSGAPVRADWVTVKSTSRSGTAKYAPFSPLKPRDGALRCETNWCRGLWRTEGDFRVKDFAHPNDFTFQAEVGICVKDIKKKVLFYSNYWREWVFISVVSLLTSHDYRKSKINRKYRRPWK